MKATKGLNQAGTPKIGIVINSRLSSSRIPKKAITKINGVPLIEHLINRLTHLNIPIVVAVPHSDFLQYSFLFDKNNVFVRASIHDTDPLARMNEMAQDFALDYVVRITHDKIFVDTDLLIDLLNTYVIKTQNPKDYVYLSKAIPGTGFEIISSKALAEASSKYKNIEYIGYSIREVTKNQICVTVDDNNYSSYIRLLIDYEDDLNLMHVIFSQLGNNCTLNQVLDYLSKDSRLYMINRLPRVTVYTCAYNSEEFIEKCINSVLSQKYVNLEYILIDDFSSDKTVEIISKHLHDPRVKFYRNEKNLGLSSSCNMALNKAKGEYIIRLDSDDWFKDNESLYKMLTFIRYNNHEIVYPDYEKHDEEKTLSVHSGNEEHHAGGALFDKAALNYIRFTEGLRGHDSLDIWIRAKEILKIGYLKEIIFCYRQRRNSLSKVNLEERNIIKSQIMEKSRCAYTNQLT